jgi:hypothetical protein
LKKAQEEEKLGNEADKSVEWNQKQAEYFNTHDSSSIANSYSRDSIEQKQNQEKHQANADKLRNPSENFFPNFTLKKTKIVSDYNFKINLY